MSSPNQFDAANRVDVAIVGGGMVGASLAIALSQACPQLRVQVLEAINLPDPGSELRYQPSYDARSSALSFGTRRIYERLGLWQRLSEHVTPIQHIHVSDRGRFGATRLHARDYRLDALGYVVENQWLGRVLWAAMQSCPQVQLRCPVTVESISEVVGGVQLQLTNGNSEPETLLAGLVVVADGGRSALRGQLRIPVERTAYAQVAVIANVSHERDHDFVAYERFTEQGPMAMLPLAKAESGEARSALVWTLPEAQAETILGGSDADFLDYLQERFGYRLGQFLRVGQRQSYPLVLERSREQVRPGLVLVGNAAHSLHPVAGQGYNLALREVTTLAEVLAATAQTRQSVGDLALLRAFEARQADDIERTLRFSDSLVKVFSNDHAGFALARDLGLLALDVVEPAKSLFARYAMGMGGHEAQWPGGLS